MMNVVNHFPKRAYLFYCFCLTVLLHFAGTCKEKKSRPPSPSFKQVQHNDSNIAQPSSPASNNDSNIAQPSSPASNNDSGTAQPSSPASNTVPMATSPSEKENQPSIISRLDRIVQEERACREEFSQELSLITDLSTRDKMIESFVAKRNQRILALNGLLKEVVDSNEAKRLLIEFNDPDKFCEEFNSVSSLPEYDGLPRHILEKKVAQKRGDITEQYNGYPVESKRKQIRGRVEALMKSVAEQSSLFPRQQKQAALCAICHATGSLGLLPCGGYVHASCLVEEMIAMWRQGYSVIYTCPVSCGSYFHFLYFLGDDAYAKTYLTRDRWKEIHCQVKGK